MKKSEVKRMSRALAGAHLSIERPPSRQIPFPYTHHALVDRDGQHVFHFFGVDKEIRNARVRHDHWGKVFTYEDLKKGRVSRVIHENPIPLDESIFEARKALGEGGYNLLTNNCEHKVRQWKSGEKESKQVQTAGWLAAIVTVAAVILPSIAPKVRGWVT